MARDINQELLELHNHDANVTASLPPSVGIERGIARGSNDHLRGLATHGPIQHSTHPARMIRAADHDDGVEMMLFAPVGEHLSLAVGAACRNRNSFNFGHSEPAQQLNQIRRLVLEWNAAASQFLFRRLRRLRENRHSIGNSAVHQVSRIHGACSASPLGHHDDVGWFNRLVDHKRPANSSQDRMSDGGYTENQAEQYDDRQDSRPAPPNAHAVMIRRIMNAGFSEDITCQRSRPVWLHV